MEALKLQNISISEMYILESPKKWCPKSKEGKIFSAIL